MDERLITQKVLNVLSTVAPNVDVKAIEPDTNFRDQFNFDSVDYLNFVLGLGREFGLELPEQDYPKFSCLSGCVAYLMSHQR